LTPVPEDTGGEPKIEYCDNCGKEMAIKRGMFGTFLACKGYPDCKTTRRLVRARASRTSPMSRSLSCARYVAITGEKTRPLRRIHRLLRLSKMQVHAPDHHGHQMSEMQ